MIRLTNLSKQYGSFTAVDAINLTVPPGELFGFLGPNGAGKTTTLRMIAGILQPTSGSVEIDGVEKTEDLDTHVAISLDRVYGIDAPTDKVREALGYVARRLRRYDPLIEYLDGLVWDKVGRLDTLLIKHGGAADHRDRQGRGHRGPQAHVRQVRRRRRNGRRGSGH